MPTRLRRSTSRSSTTAGDGGDSSTAVSVSVSATPRRRPPNRTRSLDDSMALATALQSPFSLASSTPSTSSSVTPRIVSPTRMRRSGVDGRELRRLSIDGAVGLFSGGGSNPRGGRRPRAAESNSSSDSSSGADADGDVELDDDIDSDDEDSHAGSSGFGLGRYFVGNERMSMDPNALPQSSSAQQAQAAAAFRARSGLYKQNSERRLKEALARVGDLKKLDDSKREEGRSGNNNSLRHSTATSRRSHLIRRNSTSSVGSSSSFSLSVTQTDASIDIMDIGGASTTASGANNMSSALMMMNHQSSVTLQVGNVHKTSENGTNDNKKSMTFKTDQIIESIVWFSFHIPRSVLEDLISHELDSWRRDNMKSRKQRRRRKKPRRIKDDDSGSFNLIEDDESDGSLSSLSDGGKSAAAKSTSSGDFSTKVLRLQDKGGTNDFMKMPKDTHREGALLFVDMSGFTKLSTLLDVESLSKVINAYFDMIVTEVINHGGDILKFAGDAFFAEWRVSEEDADGKDDDKSNALVELNASLASVNELNWEDDDDVPKLSTCAVMAARCAMSIVAKYSDYHVTSAAGNKSEAMLNVHCGVGVGRLTGLHVGDYKEDQEEDAIELRRELLILGDPIDQVSLAADVAVCGEVYASPEAMLSLSYVCDMDDEQRICNQPVLIASRDERYIELDNVSEKTMTVQPYESLRMHCSALNHTALARLHCQMALYVHPVIRGDELALSAAIQAGKISQPTATLESRHRAEAELRSVYTVFIKAIISHRLTGIREEDSQFYKRLADIMHVTSRELDRYSGHLRQFIVDDKGIVLIATFGLRGSTFPNMVSNNALPATFAISNALKTELSVETRIGATFGKVYCGVVGGIRRHEFAVMGAPVNLAARLMGSKVNKGILVDEAVGKQAGNRFNFQSLPPVEAKGYDKPVAIFEPSAILGRKKKMSYPFTGRVEEKRKIIEVADSMLAAGPNSQSSMVFLMGESGVGKTALASAVVEQVRRSHHGGENKKMIISSRSTSDETQQRIPLNAFKQTFVNFIRTHCELDGTMPVEEFSDRDESLSSDFGSLRTGSVRWNRRQRKMSRRHSGEILSSRRLSAGATTEGRRMSGHHVRRLSGAHTLSSHSSHRGESSKPQIPQTVGTNRRQALMRGRAMRGETDFQDVSLSTGTDAQSLRSTLSRRKSENGSQSGNSSRRFGGGLGLEPASGRQTSVHGVQVYSGSSGEASEVTESERSGTVGDSSALSVSLHRLKSDDFRQKPHGSQGAKAPFQRALSFRSPAKAQSTRRLKMTKSPSLKLTNTPSQSQVDDSSVEGSTHKQQASIPIFQKLCWICEQLDYPFEYADIIGSRFLQLECASPVTHVDGHVPTMEELSEFLILSFLCLTDHVDLCCVVVDDFQWVDAFSWKIFRALTKRSSNMLLICATRSHDKQAMRRLSTAIVGDSMVQSHMTEIALGSFDFTEIRELISLVMIVSPSAVTESLCTDIFQRTGGLPVFVVQVLENIKRKKTLELVDGVLRWTAEGLKEKRAMSTSNNTDVLEETFLSRFDTLDVRVRKVLQTCAVLGLKFALTDVIQVHPEISELDIENALDTAVDEMILVEHVVDDEDNTSLRSGSLDDDDATFSHSRGSDTHRGLDDRYFQFSHAMWRNNVLTTMLKQRKIELHRLIAEAMERDQAMVLEQSDISRLLTLFDHWKQCGDFCKSAPLALAVGARLEEWDLSAQSLELYEDALELSFDTVINSAGADKAGNSEWVKVKAKPMVLDLILRLHICIGLCHQRLGDPDESRQFFQDAYSVVKSASRMPGMSKALLMPIISSLCVLKLDQDPDSTTSDLAAEQERVIADFLSEAKASDNQVHICRALSLEAIRYARLGEFQQAATVADRILTRYDVVKHSDDMIAEYGSDFALFTIAQSVQWLYLAEKPLIAEHKIDVIIDELLPDIDTTEVDDTMLIVLPLIQVLMLLDRPKDADWLLKKYIINPYHDSGLSSFWTPLFNPLAYVLEVLLMKQADQYDPVILRDFEMWILDDANARYDLDMERKAHTLMGELAWRLACYKDDDDPAREALLERATEFLNPVARYQDEEPFLRHVAAALLEAI